MARPSQLGLTSAYERAYQAVYDAFCASGLSADKARASADNTILSQSYLRLEITLTTGNTAYQLNVLNNQNNAGQNQRPTEVRLSQQDSFFASQIGIYLALPDSATDFSYPLETYPNPIAFPTGGVALNGLYTFYNGIGSIVINNQKIVPKFAMSDFLQIPQTQAVAAPPAATTQFDPSEVVLLQPNINFVGTNQSTIDIVLPQTMSELDAGTIAVIILKGVLAQNVTVLV